MNDVVGKRVKLLVVVRAGEGKSYFKERATIIRVQNSLNINRSMWLIRFDDGASTFVFPDENEVEIIEE